MCLKQVQNTYRDKPKKVFCKDGNYKIGYKVLNSNNEYYWGPYYNSRYSFGKWQDSNSERKMMQFANDYNKYEPGFHIFTSLRSAKSYLNFQDCGYIYKVQYQDVVAIGTHHIGRDEILGVCVVARRMRVFKKDRVK